MVNTAILEQQQSRTLLSSDSARIKILIPVLFYACFLVIAVYGADFGHHWDDRLLLTSVARSVATGSILPHRYNYPSFIHDLALATVVPNIINGSSADSILARLSTYEYRVFLRKVFAAVSLLALIWIFLFVYSWRRSVIEALLALLVLGSSWEIIYHSRWMAPDSLVMQFTALSLFLMWLSMNRKSLLFLTLAAVAVGLAIGTKYTAGVLMVPLVIATYATAENHDSATRIIVLCFSMLLISGFVFLLTTPGALLQWEQFKAGITYERVHYSTGDFGHTINSPWSHSWLMLNYLAFSALSYFGPLAFILFLFALAGAYALAKENRIVAVWFFSMPLLYFGYFAFMKVMIVRNLLLLVPFLAVLSARGITLLWQKARTSAFKYSIAAIALVCFLANFGWLAYSTSTVMRRSELNLETSAADYLRNHPQRRVALSARLKEWLRERPEVVSQAATIEQADEFMFSSAEIRNKAWPANRRGFYEIVSPMYDVNFDYYPRWGGDERVVIVKKDNVLKFHLIQ